MISNEELQDIIDNPAMYRGVDIGQLAREILEHRKPPEYKKPYNPEYDDDPSQE